MSSLEAAAVVVGVVVGATLAAFFFSLVSVSTCEVF